MDRRTPTKAIERQPLQGRWKERLTLANGRELWLRPIQPNDAGPIRGAFGLLNDEEIRRRFMHPIKELSADYLRHLTHPAPGREFVLVAAEPLPPGRALIGAVARTALDPDDRSAEFALLVSRYVGGFGLGRLLLKRLISWARKRRLERIYGDVLEDNAPMLALADSLGFHREHLPDSAGLTRVVLPLRQPPPGHIRVARVRREAP